jgi:multimeric flavodoxin WrbA
MNITVFYANRRKAKSSTYGIAQRLIDNLLDEGKLFEFYLPQDMPHVCMGCYACFHGKEDRCGGYEYLRPIISAMEASELIIFCSPTYVFHTPGQIKTLLDHFGYRWMIHRPDLSFINKQAVIINTAGGGGRKSTVKDIRDSMNYWGISRTHVITQSVWDYDWSNLPDSFRKKAIRKVNKAVSKIRQNQKHIKPSFKVKLLFYIYREFHKRHKMAEIDNLYWLEKGYTKSTIAEIQRESKIDF